MNDETKVVELLPEDFYSVEGRLLIASDKLNDDPFFSEAVIYVCSHDSNGAMGVNIQKPIGEISKKELYSMHDREYTLKNNPKFPILYGGPVETDKLIVLCVHKSNEENFEENQQVTVYTDVNAFFLRYIEGKFDGKFLIARGISAWEPVQLEAEITSNDWIVGRTTLDTLFSKRIKNKWKHELKKFGGNFDFKNLVNYTGHA